MIDKYYGRNEEFDDNPKGRSHDENPTITTITPLSCTYQRGPRQEFAASKRQGTLPATSTPRLERESIHLEAKLMKENEGFGLQ